MGGDGYEGYEGYEPSYEGYEPGYQEYEPDADDFALMRFLDLLPGNVGSEGHFPDPEIDEFASGFDAEHGEESELFRAALFLRGWRLGQRIPWPFEAADPVRVLLLLLAAARCEAGPHLAPDGGDLISVPSSPLLLARTILTAAPPARVPCPAGATG